MLGEGVRNVPLEQAKSGGEIAKQPQPKAVPPSPVSETTPTALPKLVAQTDRKLQFPFTSDPLDGFVSHLTAKCGGNIHDR
jgi:hypothetical protein